jgi:type II secretory pathway pseudopilin PulG
MTRFKVQGSRFEATPPQPSTEQGFMLLGLIVAIALILIALSVAASKEAFTLHREREVESARRANQYVRAIQLYYRKFGTYPGSIEQLEKTNNVRYLRQRYVDPLTGKADYRLIPVGQNQTTVKGFFGEPLGGIASAGLGAAAGLQAIGPTGAQGATGSTDASGTSPLGSATGMQSQSATGFSGSAGPFMGVGSSASGNSIITPNDQTTYQTWEFLYDPRIEKLKLAAALNGGGPDGMGGGTLGQSPSSMGQPPSGFGTSAPPPISTTQPPSQ